MENKTTALFGGEPIEIKLADGTPEIVNVRILPVREFPRLAMDIENEAHRIEVFCAKEKGWADTLSRESHEALIAKGDELNADFFIRWVRRNLDLQEKLVPGITEKRASALLNGAQKLPSNSA